MPCLDIRYTCICWSHHMQYLRMDFRKPQLLYTIHIQYTCPYFQKPLNRHFEFRHSLQRDSRYVYYLCMYTTPPNVCLKYEGLYMSHLETQCVGSTYDIRKKKFFWEIKIGFFGVRCLEEIIKTHKPQKFQVVIIAAVFPRNFS